MKVTGTTPIGRQQIKWLDRLKNGTYGINPDMATDKESCRVIKTSTPPTVDVIRRRKRLLTISILNASMHAYVF